MPDIKSRLAQVDYSVTLCSIAPFGLREKKPGLYPGEFILNPCKDMFNDVETLLVDESRFYVYMDLERGSFPVRTSPEQVAVSIVNDYINAQVAVSENCYPGLFLCPGRPNKAEILESDLITIARDIQVTWFQALVQLADDDWERYRQHRVISDIQRHAARQLKLERDWVIAVPDVRTIESVVCLVCRTPLAPETILCPQCNFVINPEAFEKVRDRFFNPQGAVKVGVQPLNAKEPVS